MNRRQHGIDFSQSILERWVLTGASFLVRLPAWPSDRARRVALVPGVPPTTRLRPPSRESQEILFGT
jgi:hypothetical protein